MATITVDTSLIVDGQTIDAADVTLPIGQLKTGIENTINGIQAFDQISIGAPPATLIIAANAITITRSRHRIDTSGAPDTLATINGFIDGDLLWIEATSAARAVTVKHNTGNIWLSGLNDVVLDDPNRVLVLLYDATPARWVQVGEAVPVIRTPNVSTLTSVRQLVLPEGTYRQFGANASSQQLDLAPGMTSRNWWAIRAAGPNFTTVGIPAVTITGSSTVTASNQTDSTYLNSASAAVAGNGVGFVPATYNYTRFGYSPTFETVIRTTGTAADITSIFYWLGLLSTTAPNSATLGAVSGLCFRFATGTDSNWQYVVSNGAAQTVVDSGVAVAVNTKYTFRIRTDGSANAYFSINNGAETTITTNLPAAATELGPTLVGFNQAAASRNILFRSMICYYN